MWGVELMLTLCSQIRQAPQQWMFLRPVPIILCFNSQMMIKTNNLLMLRVRREVQLGKLTNLNWQTQVLSLSRMEMALFRVTLNHQNSNPIIIPRYRQAHNLFRVELVRKIITKLTVHRPLWTLRKMLTFYLKKKTMTIVFRIQTPTSWPVRLRGFRSTNWLEEVSATLQTFKTSPSHKIYLRPQEMTPYFSSHRIFSKTCRQLNRKQIH